MASLNNEPSGRSRAVLCHFAVQWWAGVACGGGGGSGGIYRRRLAEKQMPAATRKQSDEKNQNADASRPPKKIGINELKGTRHTLLS